MQRPVDEEGLVSLRAYTLRYARYSQQTHRAGQCEVIYYYLKLALLRRRDCGQQATHQGFVVGVLE